jgi:hypothetical protein
MEGKFERGKKMREEGEASSHVFIFLFAEAPHTHMRAGRRKSTHTRGELERF